MAQQRPRTRPNRLGQRPPLRPSHRSRSSRRNLNLLVSERTASTSQASGSAAQSGRLAASRSRSTIFSSGAASCCRSASSSTAFAFTHAA